MNKEKSESESESESEREKEDEDRTVSAQTKVSEKTMQMLLNAKHRLEKEKGQPISMNAFLKRIIIEGVEEEEEKEK